MKKYLCVGVVCLTAACGGSGGSVSNDSGPIPISDLPKIAVSYEPSMAFADGINDVRSAAGVGAVSYNARLGAAARRHANDMHGNDFFSHIGSDGSTIGERVSDAGYVYSLVGENIAWGQQDEAAVLAAWQSSTGHRRNNENGVFQHFGLAKAGGANNRYWVLVLAAPR